ncbi:DUF1697 domain-containing protein [Galbitalea soli]|uniref:DUF1697 domain-containing protein n=1 Tax=Galbitalea soli TaxID=1268042 RepID=A0A7C9PNL4_9MICO|nr:DUF1697 domain-containing protein [Galbitalea soli]NEM91647.1 DUF1697 domain-containing protein [Galbitalea soli]NYJ30343.1 uncharacterized protein (DUF1697 family) [Galbitalea soli]
MVAAREVPPVGRFVILLRGINVGPSKRIAMAELRRVLEEAGFERVQTVLQSGNAVVDAAAGHPDARALEAAIAAATGVSCRVVVVDAARFLAIVDAFPFSEVADDESRALITFVERMPDPAQIVRPSDAELAPERLALGREAIYQWLPHGVLATRLPSSFLRQFGAEATARNLRTSRRIAALLTASH